MSSSKVTSSYAAPGPSFSLPFSTALSRSFQSFCIPAHHLQWKHLGVSRTINLSPIFMPLQILHQARMLYPHSCSLPLQMLPNYCKCWNTLLSFSKTLHTCGKVHLINLYPLHLTQCSVNMCRIGGWYLHVWLAYDPNVKLKKHKNCKMVESFGKTVWLFLKMSNIMFPSDSAIPLLGLHLREMKRYVLTKTHTQISMPVLFIISQKWE